MLLYLANCILRRHSLIRRTARKHRDSPRGHRRDIDPPRQEVPPTIVLTRNIHDRLVVLREQHLPILESLRRSLWHRRNARLGFENESQVAVLSVDTHFSSQQVLQAVKRAHDGEPLLVHDHSSLLRATKGAAQKPKWVMAHFSTSTPSSSSAFGTCVKKLPQWLSEASETSALHIRPSGAIKRRR